MALDRELARLASEQEAEHVLGNDHAIELKPMIDSPELLSEHVENYKPASSHVTLEEQVFQAKGVGADSIEAEDIVFKGIFGRIPSEPYAVYKNIKVYRIGMVKAGQDADNVELEDRIFGARK